MAGEAVAVIEPDEQVGEIGFSPTTTPVARGALRALILEYTAEVSAAHGHDVVDTPLGRARVQKTPDGRAKRVEYEELDALPEGFDPTTIEIESSSEGPDDVVSTKEELRAEAPRGVVSKFHARTSLSATLVRTAREPKTPPPDYVPAPIRPTYFLGILPKPQLVGPTSSPGRGRSFARHRA